MNHCQNQLPRPEYPRPEYPRPGFERKEWLCLNGSWDFYYDQEHTSIQVPFVCQSKQSGIGVRIQTDYVTYERKVTIPAHWRGKEILLHFGAVDYACEVYVNGHKATSHQGGNSSFSTNITPFLMAGDQTIRVEVYDPLSNDTIPRGKQFWQAESDFIWYTPSTGIWQTVWLEPVSQTNFEWIHYTPNLDRGEVEICYQLAKDSALPCQAEFSIFFDQEQVCSVSIACNQTRNKLTVSVFGNRSLEGSFHFTGRYWTPEHPVLYYVTAVLKHNKITLDEVSGYFGMRKVHVENGRFYLNNLPYYNKLILDQGYWEDSLITAPSDDAFKTDIEKFKAMGFNGCRKHEKVEDQRFLYWADHLGFLVWVGMASFWSYTPQAAADFTKEWCDVIQRDYNHPCIVVWGMLNESWGVPRLYDDPTQQHFSQMLYHLAYSLDQTRLVIANDGWEQTITDICALHSYQHGTTDDLAQQKTFKESLQDLSSMHRIVERLPFAKGYEYSGQPFMLTEFGGISLAGNATDSSWGYTVSETEADFLATYERILTDLYASNLLCGYCYTQATDVEQETNGLLDQQHNFKFPPEKLKEINDRMI